MVTAIKCICHPHSGIFTNRIDRFPFPHGIRLRAFSYFSLQSYRTRNTQTNPVCAKPKHASGRLYSLLIPVKGTSYGRSLPLQAITGSTPGARGCGSEIVLSRFPFRVNKCDPLNHSYGKLKTGNTQMQTTFNLLNRMEIWLMKFTSIKSQNALASIH